MKSWGALSERGKLRRLRGVAWRALERFPVAPTRLRLVGGFTNAVFRVDTASAKYALRVDLWQDHTDADVTNELAWLAALERAQVRAARYVPSRDGEAFVYATAEGVPEARRCVLFRWIGGRPLAARPTPESYRRLGRLSAQLHAHGRAVELPTRPMAWDRVFYYPPSVDPVVIFDDAMAHHLEGGRRETLERAMAVAERAFAERDRAALQVVHGDLHPWNVHLLRGEPVALDFEDIMWAHPVQDVAITLYYLEDRDDYAALRASFERGYRELGTWPETYAGEIDRFIAARRLMFVNLVGRLSPDPSEFFAKAFPRLEAFLAAS